ncbi:MAG TPA: CYTH domain-containing protein [Phycisphaerales bacterium]|nr:CYTH domain-containing protein [Phycisphaerales bacterium]
MHNVEYKAELRDLPMARAACRSAGAAFIAELEQTDTYFRVPSGRLKRRECAGEPTEWIFYDRRDEARPRLSCFTIYSDAQARERFGVAPLPELVVVRKRRELHLLNNVRIHLDHVERLGRFIEFEAFVSPGFPVAACHAAVDRLRTLLAPALGEPLSGSYADLLLQELRTAPGRAN